MVRRDDCTDGGRFHELFKQKLLYGKNAVVKGVEVAKGIPFVLLSFHFRCCEKGAHSQCVATLAVFAFALETELKTDWIIEYV